MSRARPRRPAAQGRAGARQHIRISQASDQLRQADLRQQAAGDGEERALLRAGCVVLDVAARADRRVASSGSRTYRSPIALHQGRGVAGAACLAAIKRHRELFFNQDRADISPIGLQSPALPATITGFCPLRPGRARAGRQVRNQDCRRAQSLAIVARPSSRRPFPFGIDSGAATLRRIEIRGGAHPAACDGCGSNRLR